MEMLLWDGFKIDPFGLLDELSFMDFCEYVKVLCSRKEEQLKQRDPNKMLKMLAFMRDMLNTMKLPEY